MKKLPLLGILVSSAYISCSDQTSNNNQIGLTSAEYHLERHHIGWKALGTGVGLGCAATLATRYGICSSADGWHLPLIVGLGIGTGIGLTSYVFRHLSEQTQAAQITAQNSSQDAQLLAELVFTQRKANVTNAKIEECLEKITYNSFKAVDQNSLINYPIHQTAEHTRKALDLLLAINRHNSTSAQNSALSSGHAATQTHKLEAIEQGIKELNKLLKEHKDAQPEATQAEDTKTETV